MVLRILSLIKVVLIMSSLNAAWAKDISIKNVFQKPLILGASVSANYFTDSPGRTLALRHTDSKNILTIAKSGQAGRETLKEVNLSTLKDRTVIVGVDLFFWDSTKPDAKESIGALKRLMSQVEQKNIPIVLGEIPTLLPHMQPSIAPLNEAIREACKNYDKCHILPLNKILHQTLSDGYLTHRGKKYQLEELIPDGLHLVKPASEFLADKISEFWS